MSANDPALLLDDTADFFYSIFGRCSSGYTVIWSLPSKRSKCFAVSDPEGAAEYALALDARGEDVYFGVCPQREPLAASERGKAETVASVPVLWLDVDLQAPPDAHKASNEVLAPNGDAVIGLLNSIPGLPACSGVVHSGYGLHAYWLLSAPATPSAGSKAVRAVQAVVQAAAATREWHVDTTSDLPRVLRVPGGHNRKRAKHDDVQRVGVLAFDGPEHNLSAFDDVIKRALLLKPAANDHGTTRADKDPGCDPSRALDVEMLREEIKRSRKPELEKLRKALKGESIAEGGSRDPALLSVCMTLANKAPHNDAAQLADLLRPMLAVWAAEPGAALTVDEEIEKAIDKIERGQEKRRREDADSEAFIATERAANIAEATGGERTTAYTIEEVEALAVRLGVDAATLSHRWIIQSGREYYVLKGDGDYKPPIDRDEVLASVVRDLAPAPVDLRVITKQGSRAKSGIELVSEYGRVARKVQLDLTADRYSYDAASEAFTIPVVGRRQVAAVEHTAVDAWLRLLGGNRAEKLFDWLATFPRLERSTAILYLWGPKDCGKGLLVSGLAHFFGGNPSRLADVCGQFNEDIMRCPLVWSDEYLPENATSGKLCELNGGSSDGLTISRKGRKQIAVKGTPRIVITANTGGLLRGFDEDFQHHQIDALGSRIFVVEAGAAAVDYLAALVPGGTDGWPRKIAEHITWLAQTRSVHSTGKFWVAGDAHQLAEQVAMSGGLRSRIVEWIGRYLDSGVGRTDLIRAGNDELLVSTDYISKNWIDQIEGGPRPSISKLGAAMANIAPTTRRVLLKGGKRAVLREVNVLAFLREVERLEIGDTEAIRARICGHTVFDQTPAPSPGASN